VLKPTRVELGPEGFRVFLESAPAPKIDPVHLAYRSDGWPLCPRCGDDALVSQCMTDRKRLVKNGRTVAGGPMPTDEMTCSNCRWNGGVPRRDEAKRWGLIE